MFQNDFTNFSAQAYLKEYYSDLNPENKMLLSFYDKFYKSIPRVSTMLEVGGGPTIYQLISACEKVDSIVFSEFAESNRDEIKRFINGDKDAWNWDSYISYVLEKDGKIPTAKVIGKIKNKIRSKITRVIFCDIRVNDPLTPEKFPLFDLLSMGSVADSIAATEEELQTCLKNAFSMLKSGGYFVGFFAKNFKTWTQLDTIYHIYPIDEKYVRDIFPKLGLKIIDLTNSQPPDYQQDYEGIFAVSAIKE